MGLDLSMVVVEANSVYIANHYYFRTATIPPHSGFDPRFNARTGQKETNEPTKFFMLLVLSPSYLAPFDRQKRTRSGVLAFEVRSRECEQSSALLLGEIWGPVMEPPQAQTVVLTSNRRSFCI
jgi:hypothetical protein